MCILNNFIITNFCFLGVIENFASYRKIVKKLYPCISCTPNFWPKILEKKCGLYPANAIMEMITDILKKPTSPLLNSLRLPLQLYIKDSGRFP